MVKDKVIRLFYHGKNKGIHPKEIELMDSERFEERIYLNEDEFEYLYKEFKRKRSQCSSSLEDDTFRIEIIGPKIPECCYCSGEGWCICDKCKRHVCLSHVNIHTYFGKDLKTYTCYGCEYNTFRTSEASE